MENFIVKKKEDTTPPQSGAQNMLQPGQSADLKGPSKNHLTCVDLIWSR
jgi:hypothetical protein